MIPTENCIVSLDVGTSSVRTLLFDSHARQVEGFGTQVSYDWDTTPDGGQEVDARGPARLAVECLSFICRQMREAGIRPAAVAFCTYWHNVLGVGQDGTPTTPIIHLFDTRPTGAANEIGKRTDAQAQQSRTGVVLHPSYLPAKLLWLSWTHPGAFAATQRWMSFGEYLYFQLFGRWVGSSSMASGTGLWNQNANDYDEGILSVLPVKREQLAPVEEMNQGLCRLLPEYAALWPEFDGIPWFPALGDGACNNIGSGCITPDRFALMVGTSAAMRGVSEASHMDIPKGLWCYRVDPKRFVLGGALSNGGGVFAWMKRTLALPHDEQIETELAAMQPGSHGLTMLPFFAGERATGWRGDARAAIIGMSSHTRPIDILRAALEAVALRLRNLYEVMVVKLGEPREVVVSGGALDRSPAWTQMMADALGRPVVECLEKEATSRGAALLALERIGLISHIRELPAETGAVVEPNPAYRAIYEEQLQRQRRLYKKVIEES